MAKTTIKTNFAVGDSVWFIYEGDKIKHGTIRSIEVKVKELISIKYDIKLGFSSYLVTCDEYHFLSKTYKHQNTIRYIYCIRIYNTQRIDSFLFAVPY